MSYTIINRVEVVRESGMIHCYVNSHDSNVRPCPTAYERKLRGGLWSTLSFSADADTELIALQIERVALDYDGRGIREGKSLTGLEAYSLWRSRFKRVGVILRGCRPACVSSRSPYRSLDKRQVRPGVSKGQLVSSVTNAEFTLLRSVKVCHDLAKGRNYYVSGLTVNGSRCFRKTHSSGLRYDLMHDPKFFAETVPYLAARDGLGCVNQDENSAHRDDLLCFATLSEGKWLLLGQYYINHAATVSEALHLRASDGPEFLRRIREDIPGIVVISLPANQVSALLN